jgi:hypothetical protein
MELIEDFFVPIPPEKRKWGGPVLEEEIRPLLKFHMKIES